MGRRERWRDELAEITARMLWGSLASVYRRCGHPGCHCTTGEKHGPVFYLSRREEGRTRMVYVPTELRDEAAAGVEAFRRYRALGIEIAEANARALGLGRKRRR